MSYCKHGNSPQWCELCVLETMTDAFVKLTEAVKVMATSVDMMAKTLYREQEDDRPLRLRFWRRK